MDHAPIRRLRHRRREQPALSLPALARHHGALGGLRSAHPNGLRQRPPHGRGRGRPRRCGGFLAGRHGTSVPGHPVAGRFHVHDHQFHRQHLAGLLRAGGATPGGGPPQALRHHSERHPEGVHRPRHLHLSPASGHAHHHRHLRLGARRDAGLEYHFDQRISHSGSRLYRHPGTGVHLRQRHRLH